MPATYAHYRFGRLALPALPGELGQTIRQFRQVYDVGLHGPDLFFYYQPLFHTRTGELGYTLHRLSGKAFFERCARHQREHPSPAGEAYLMGVLGHYTLDSLCHPQVNALARAGIVGHTALETEFDRALLSLDGADSPQTTDISRHLRLTLGQCRIVSGFYPGAGTMAIRQSVATMAAINRAQAMRRRELVRRAFRLGGREDMVMGDRPDPKCIPHTAALHTLFDQALAAYPAMAEQLLRCIHDRAPLGEGFEATFG